MVSSFILIYVCIIGYDGSSLSLVKMLLRIDLFLACSLFMTYANLFSMVVLPGAMNLIYLGCVLVIIVTVWVPDFS